MQTFIAGKSLHESHIKRSKSEEQVCQRKNGKTLAWKGEWSDRR